MNALKQAVASYAAISDGIVWTKAFDMVSSSLKYDHDRDALSAIHTAHMECKKPYKNLVRDVYRALKSRGLTTGQDHQSFIVVLTALTDAVAKTTSSNATVLVQNLAKAFTKSIRRQIDNEDLMAAIAVDGMSDGLSIDLALVHPEDKALLPEYRTHVVAEYALRDAAHCAGECMKPRKSFTQAFTSALLRYRHCISLPTLSQVLSDLTVRIKDLERQNTDVPEGEQQSNTDLVNGDGASDADDKYLLSYRDACGSQYNLLLDLRSILSVDPVTVEIKDHRRSAYAYTQIHFVSTPHTTPLRIDLSEKDATGILEDFAAKIEALSQAVAAAQSDDKPPVDELKMQLCGMFPTSLWLADAFYSAIQQLAVNLSEYADPASAGLGWLHQHVSIADLSVVPASPPLRMVDLLAFAKELAQRGIALKPVPYGSSSILVCGILDHAYGTNDLSELVQRGHISEKLCADLAEANIATLIAAYEQYADLQAASFSEELFQVFNKLNLELPPVGIEGQREVSIAKIVHSLFQDYERTTIDCQSSALLKSRIEARNKLLDGLAEMLGSVLKPPLPILPNQSLVTPGVHYWNQEQMMKYAVTFGNQVSESLLYQLKYALRD